MRNQRPGVCRHCHQPVAAGEGRAVRVGRDWLVEHPYGDVSCSDAVRDGLVRPLPPREPRVACVYCLERHAGSCAGMREDAEQDRAERDSRRDYGRLL